MADNTHRTIGVISDTHGVLPKGISEAFRGVGHIVHAGDIGGQEVLAALEQIAPVTAVRGNMDHGQWAQSLPPFELISFNGTLIYVLHDRLQLDLEPTAADIRVVISGHTHRPEMKTAHGVLYFNPGSASHSRYGTPLSVGRIGIASNRIDPELIQMDNY